MSAPSVVADRFRRCAAGLDAAGAAAGLVDDLVELGYDLPSVYLLTGERLRCYAARGYFQVVDGFGPGEGIVGGVVATGQTVVVPDVSLCPDFIAAVPGIRGEVCAPVRLGDTVVGAVNVETRTALRDDARAVLEQAAAHLSRRLAALGGLPRPSLAQRLAQASVGLTAAATTAELEHRAVRAAADLAGMSTAAVVRLSPDGNRVTEAHGPLARQVRRWTSDELATMSTWVSHGTSSYFPGGDRTPAGYDFLRAAGVRALSVHPMVVGGRTTGLLVLAGSVPLAHAPVVVDCLELLAAQTAALLGLIRALREVSRRADRDDLTGLANRSQYPSAVHTAERACAEGESVAVLLLDLDDFKHVNDSLGHHAGDRLLCEVARRLQASLREGDTPCRLGGDEFAIVLPATGALAAEAAAERLLDALALPLVLDDAVLEVTASIGVAVSAGAGDDPEQLLRAADLAMYLAKKRGKGRSARFEPSMQLAALDRLALENDLRRAVREQSLSVAYQPVVELGTGRLCGVEALVRWHDPARGTVPPGDFIPLAEETGLVHALGEWVLREACRQLAAWDAAGGDPELRMAVNVSTRQLERPGLLEAVDAALAGGLSPHRLVLEITETALTVDGSTALRTLEELRTRGVDIALDDFGTGYSSLDRLRSSPIDQLKIDRAFVAEIDVADAHVPIVDATLSMAAGLGLTVVAEGIETPEQLAHLRAAGCQEAQGFLLSRPLPAAEVPYARGTRPPWAHLFDGPAGPTEPRRPD